jgi:hypothetical protein
MTEPTPAEPTTTQPTQTGPTPAEPAPSEEVAERRVERSTEARLARLHLRTGAYSLARVELETLAGAGTLDDEALLDLAEVRWRTDDLTGAGEAAAAYLASGRVAPIALIVAAEATSALGRPGEARRLAGRALELIDGSLDAIFAGMPRSDVWPVQTVERVPSPASADGPATDADGPVADGPVADGPVADASGRAAVSGPDDGVADAVAGDGGHGSVVAVPMAAFNDAERDPHEPLPDAAAELAAARDALAGGDRSGAAIRLSIVLRLAPSLAPAVLDLAASVPGAEFDLVRGDAFRLVGRESQARRAFAAASRQATSDTAAADAGPDGDQASGSGD